MTVLTIDLGSTIGWSVTQWGITTSGTVKFNRVTGRKTIADEHEGIVYERFVHWLKETFYLNNPDRIIFEEPMGNFKSAAARNIIVGMRGVLMAYASHFSIPIDGIPQTKRKKFATGKGNAKKEDMLSACLEKIGPVVNHNEADALWLAEWAKETYGC